VTEPGRPAPDDEQGRSDPDAGAGRPVQLGSEPRDGGTRQ
jgi:hypothetical protein